MTTLETRPALSLATVQLAIARELITTAFDHAESQRFQPLAVAVLDAGGHLVAFERQDGASFMRFEVAFGKAHGALAVGTGSRSLFERAEVQPSFVQAAVSAANGRMIPVPGGVLIVDAESQIVGAVGVSGDVSDNDEAAAVVAIERAGYRAVTS